MILLEQLSPGMQVRGLDGARTAEIIAVERFGSQAANVTYRAGQTTASRILYLDDQVLLEQVTPGRAFAFSGDGESFRLASEANRIRLAHLFDPYLAVETSRIDALPGSVAKTAGLPIWGAGLEAERA